MEWSFTVHGLGESGSYSEITAAVRRCLEERGPLQLPRSHARLHEQQQIRGAFVAGRCSMRYPAEEQDQPPADSDPAKPRYGRRAKPGAPLGGA
eukprot:jgi/Tetstr1/428369/TSEL_018404.t1